MISIFCNKQQASVFDQLLGMERDEINATHKENFSSNNGLMSSVTG